MRRGNRPLLQQRQPLRHLARVSQPGVGAEPFEILDDAHLVFRSQAMRRMILRPELACRLSTQHRDAPASPFQGTP
ncbi:hypothetical protein CDO87_13775 [Sagittula sp. P11]|nr:hypothetical protein CDO87_13775 [Sagittula sp. P11]